MRRGRVVDGVAALGEECTSRHAHQKAVSERGDCTYGTTCLFVPQEVTGGSPQSISRIRVAARIQADGGVGPLARVGKGDGDAGPTDNGGGPACFSGLHYKAPLPRPSAGGHRCGAVATPSVTDEVAPSALLLGHIAPPTEEKGMEGGGTHRWQVE
ncbi:hypothetical protein OsI_23913 [Oryza sativa Indica Group]|uniref:Uncharacterized protein n=1 Tax=Oryza sativa subsp. indica TaxID=39946 RepID=B8B0S0_ORYSI|nr:hypothetical protein OsI_23913 [Oryza sativa Indica Group]